MPTTTKPVVVALYPLEPSLIEYGRTRLDLITYDDPRAKEWKQIAEGVMVRTNAITPKEVADIGPQLKFVVKHGVGVNVIAVEELKSKGVLVMNTPGVNAGAVAELALSLMLALSRNIAAIDRRIRSGVQVDKAEEGRVGIQLFGRSFGIIGGGNIGLYLAKMIRGAFDGTIYLYDPVLSDTNLQRWADLVPSTHFHRVQTVKEMLPHIDVLSLHVPLLNSTRDLMGEEELRMMQPHSILINTARGGIVNESALLQALNEGWISAAGIDAYEKEPFALSDYPGLISHDKVISTPHIGAASLDVIRETARSVIDHMADAFSGSPRDVVA